MLVRVVTCSARRLLGCLGLRQNLKFHLHFALKTFTPTNDGQTSVNTKHRRHVSPPIDIFSRYLQQLHLYGPIDLTLSGGVTRPIHMGARRIFFRGGQIRGWGRKYPSGSRDRAPVGVWARLPPEADDRL